MKVGFLVNQAASYRGFERVVSGHVQVPMRTMDLLARAGHEPHLITTRWDPERYSLPDCTPPGLPVHQVEDGRRRGSGPAMFVGHRRGVRPLALARQLTQIARVVRREGISILHLFGAVRMFHLAWLLRAVAGYRGALVLTLVNGPLPDKAWPVTRAMAKAVDLVLTSTRYLASRAEALGLPVRRLPHGIWRTMDVARDALRDTVLFWRDPSTENGADLCVEAFSHLAPRYPGLRFVFAVRPHPDPVPGIDRLAEAHPNVEVYRFPYPEGVTLDGLVERSLAVALPFRALTIQPQMAVLETMAAGRAVVTTAIGSNPEAVEHGRTGLLVPAGDAAALTRSLESLLRDPDSAILMGRRAARRAPFTWEGYLDGLLAAYGMVSDET